MYLFKASQCVTNKNAAGAAPLTLWRGKKGEKMTEKEKEMPLDLKIKWEQMQECYKVLKDKKGQITCKMIDGEPVKYTEKCRKVETWGEIMDRKKSITIGEYKVQQPTEKHVSVVQIKENRMVFYKKTDHWCSEEELKAVFAECMSQFEES